MEESAVGLQGKIACHGPERRRDEAVRESESFVKRAGKQSQGQESTVGVPTTQFAQAGDVNIGYQVIGDGPIDLLLIWGGFSNIEVAWEEPSFAAFMRRLAEFARVIFFDRRGCGVSDREGTNVIPTLEERMEDIIAVLGAVGSKQASIVGTSEGGNLAALFAATHPELTTSLVLYGTMGRFRKDADHPWGWMDDATTAVFEETLPQLWGVRSDLAVQMWAPSMVSDERFIDWTAKFTRQSASRGAVLTVMRSAQAYDVVDVFPAVHVPTLILHRRDDALVPIGQSRHIAERMPDARFVELAGVDHLFFLGDIEVLLTEIQSFLLGAPVPARGQRRLLTIVFTDIAGSTQMLQRVGDETWREMLAAHDRTTRDYLARFEGEEVKQLGDGFLAVFDGPARAIRCALGIVDAGARLGLPVRAGLHTGECEVVDSDVQGIAVHVAQRIAALAASGQILVSSTVSDLVAGSGIRFGESHDVQLEGISGSRSVLPVLRHGATPDAARLLAIDQANMLRRDGEYWTVAYDGLVVSLRDTKGLRDLARLLASPQRELHVMDLATPVGVPQASSQEAVEAGLSVEASSNATLIDDAAKEDYKRRIEELQEEIHGAEARGDAETGATAREELDFLVQELSSAYGIGGRPRRTPDHIERARKAVTRRIRDALGRIERVHPALGRHLNASVRTGVFCSYEPERDLVWTIESG